MAAGNFTLFSPAVLSLGTGGYNFLTDTYNVILLTQSYVPNPNGSPADTLYGDISSNEVVAGGGYTTGGQQLTGITWTRSGASSTFAAQSPVWAGSTLAARYGVVCRRASTSLTSTDRLLGYVDLTGGGNATSSASVFQINWNNSSTPSSANTLFTLVHNP